LPANHGPKITCGWAWELTLRFIKASLPPPVLSRWLVEPRLDVLLRTAKARFAHQCTRAKDGDFCAGMQRLACLPAVLFEVLVGDNILVAHCLRSIRYQIVVSVCI
jgi:hypothetical protein